MYQVLIIIDAILFLLLIPADTPVFYHSVTIWSIFLLLVFMIIQLYQKGVVGVALYFLIIAIYFNPMFLSIQKMHMQPIAYGMVAISFFLIALKWKYINRN